VENAGPENAGPNVRVENAKTSMNAASLVDLI